MDNQLIWSNKALRDIDTITDAVAKKSRQQAVSILEKISELVDSLLCHPLKGSIVPELKNIHVREVFLFDNRIIYRIQTTTIEIISVIPDRHLLPVPADRLVQEPVVLYAVKNVKTKGVYNHSVSDIKCYIKGAGEIY